MLKSVVIISISALPIYSICTFANQGTCTSIQAEYLSQNLNSTLIFSAYADQNNYLKLHTLDVTIGLKTLPGRSFSTVLNSSLVVGNLGGMRGDYSCSAAGDDNMLWVSFN